LEKSWGGAPTNRNEGLSYEVNGLVIQNLNGRKERRKQKGGISERKKDVLGVFFRKEATNSQKTIGFRGPVKAPKKPM